MGSWGSRSQIEARSNTGRIPGIQLPLINHQQHSNHDAQADCLAPTTVPLQFRPRLKESFLPLSRKEERPGLFAKTGSFRMPNVRPGPTVKKTLD